MDRLSDWLPVWLIGWALAWLAVLLPVLVLVAALGVPSLLVGSGGYACDYLGPLGWSEKRGRHEGCPAVLFEEWRGAPWFLRGWIE